MPASGTFMSLQCAGAKFDNICLTLWTCILNPSLIQLDWSQDWKRLIVHTTFRCDGTALECQDAAGTSPQVFQLRTLPWSFLEGLLLFWTGDVHSLCYVRCACAVPQQNHTVMVVSNCGLFCGSYTQKYNFFPQCSWACQNTPKCKLWESSGKCEIDANNMSTGIFDDIDFESLRKQ